jgi:hypothetical protein
MRSPATPFRVALLALLGVGCADDLALSHPVRECTATSRAIDAYVTEIAGLVSNRTRDDVLEGHETVSLSFALGADGSASEFQVPRASRPAAGQEVLRAAAAAAPYPRPPFDPKACLVGGRATISLIGHMRCDDTVADEYTDVVANQSQKAAIAAELYAPEQEQVALRIKVSREGAPSITVHDAKSTEAGEQLAALARAVPFETPGDSIAECVADHPFFVWIQLPGLTRPPIRIPDR